MLTARPGTRSARARLSHALNAARAIPLLLLVVVGPACDSFGSSPSAARSSPTPEPVDVLPPPGPPSPVPVPVGPRPVEPLAVPASPGPGLATDATVASTGERVRVVNTEGQGANLRAEPRGGADRVKTIREGAELEIVGADREADGRRWRNVREGTDGARR